MKNEKLINRVFFATMQCIKSLTPGLLLENLDAAVIEK
jgi:hypothetical protein